MKQLVLFVFLLGALAPVFAQEAEQEIPEFVQQMQAGFQASYRGEHSRFYPRAKEEAWGEVVIVTPDYRQQRCWWYAYRVGNGCLRLVFSRAMAPAQFERIPSDWRAENTKSLRATTREGEMVWISEEEFGLTVLSTDAATITLDEVLEQLCRSYLIYFPAPHRPPNHKVPIGPAFISEFEAKATAVGYTPIKWGLLVNGRPYITLYMEDIRQGGGPIVLLVVGGRHDEATQDRLLALSLEYRWEEGEGGAISAKESPVKGPDGKILWPHPVDFAVLGVKNFTEAQRAISEFEDNSAPVGISLSNRGFCLDLN